jgi:nicotinamide riboside kinase
MKIAILGAECTGKTTLTQALLPALAAQQLHVQFVAEYLREWCDTQQRTPRADEQAHIAQVQMDRSQVRDRTQQPHSQTLVLCDTSALMTAVYSDILFHDTSLYARALEDQRSFGLTLVTGLDLPWVADGIQRDGLAVRAQVDQRLREVLRHNGIAFSALYGQADARTQSALQALDHALGTPRPKSERSNWKWPCEKCSDPQCEHRLFSDMLKNG